LENSFKLFPIPAKTLPKIFFGCICLPLEKAYGVPRQGSREKGNPKTKDSKNLDFGL
jgi:hypothetical protein